MGRPVLNTWDSRPLKRLTLVIRAGSDRAAAVPTIEHVFYPVFPPGEHAAEVLAWLASAG